MNYNLQLPPGHFRVFVPRESREKRDASILAGTIDPHQGEKTESCLGTMVVGRGGVNEELR